MTALLDVDDVQVLVQAVIDKYPDNVNPVGMGGVCVYDDGHGHHCLVGQLVVDQGWNLPDDNESAFEAALEAGWPVTYDAAKFLGNVQSQADGGPSRKPIPWRDVDLTGARS